MYGLSSMCTPGPLSANTSSLASPSRITRISRGSDGALVSNQYAELSNKLISICMITPSVVFPARGELPTTSFLYEIPSFSRSPAYIA